MSKLLDDLQGRAIGVYENPEYDQEVSLAAKDKLKTCALCGKPFIKNRRAVYCNRLHYTTCVNCGNHIDLTDNYFRAGFVPKTCCKTCADTVGAQTMKDNCMKKYGVTNPMFVQEYADRAFIRANPHLDLSMRKAEEVRTCKICGKEFTAYRTDPKQCCSVECASALRAQHVSEHTKICKLCGKPFTSDFGTSLYCPGPHYVSCVVCGKLFAVTNLTAPVKTCSTKCRHILASLSNHNDGSREIQIASAKKSGEHKVKICALCGKSFIPRTNAQKVCDDVHYRKCEVCGKSFVITRPSASQLCCSKECTTKKRQSTISARFGVPNALQNPDVLAKAQQTTLEHFGVKHAAQSEEIKARMQHTCIEKYGVPTPFLMDDFSEKTKNTCLRKYGVEYITQSEQFKQRGEQSCIEKYGVRRPMQSREIHKKAGETRRDIQASDGLHLDSSYEVLVYDFWKALGLEVERNIPIKFEYGGAEHITFIDFRVGGILYEVKGQHLLNGIYDYAGVPMSVKLDIYKKHHVVVITDKSEFTLGLFGKPNSKMSNGLKYLDKCPEPLIGVDIALFGQTPEFPYALDRPKCFYDVRVDGKPSAAEAFQNPAIRWKMIANRIQYSGGFIDNKQVLTAMNVTRTCKQPSWFSKTLAIRLISTYCSQDIIYDLAAGWGARYDACQELHKTYVACDYNKELVDWHHKNGRNRVWWHDGRTFTYAMPCSIFICPPYSDPNTGRCFEDYNFDGFDESAQSLTQCQWLQIAMRNAPDFADATMVCKVVDPGWEEYVVETLDNESHFGTNHEYVIHITREQYLSDFQ